MKARLRIISPRAESPYGKAIEVFGPHFAVVRVARPDKADAREFDRIQRSVGMPVLVLGHDQEIELLEVTER